MPAIGGRDCSMVRAMPRVSIPAPRPG
jgi:hypothetical protein